MISSNINVLRNNFLLLNARNIIFKSIFLNSKYFKYFSLKVCDKNLIFNYVKSSFDKTPDSKKYESFWYKNWQDNKLFQIKKFDENQKILSMILPPPNITGDLHVGHALTITIEDIIYRYKKIENPHLNAVFIPSYDHAGLGLWSVLDKYIFSKEGKRLKNLSKKEFLNISEKWKNERIISIRNQLKLLGASLDFSNEKFTLDYEINKAVNQAFHKLFEMGLIYRSESMVNWCYHLSSTISDIEIDWINLEKKTSLSFVNKDNKMDFGVLYKFLFKLQDGKNEITVATTRPYTIPGDTGILVNPDDERYQKFIGKNAINPLTNELLPIKSDSSIKKNFGTGAVKITPACSPIDFEFSKVHNLKFNNIFNDRGNICVNNLKKELGYLNGLSRFEAQNKIIEIFDKLNQFKGIEDYKSTIPVCSKSGDLIEYKLKSQWYLNLKNVNKVLEEKINNKEIKFIQPNYANSMLNWIKNDKDWCISRQTWWGHQIPMYKATNKVDENKNWIYGENYEDALAKLKLKYGSDVKIEQDNDVMDTWFSSSLLPLIYFGWPNIESDLFKKFFPLSLIETGFDILNFWVYKMLCISWYLTGKLPFNLIILHGMIVDGRGKKMSKSLGNVIDPLDVLNGITLKEMNNKLHQSFKKGLISNDQLKSALEDQAQLYPKGLIKNSVDGLRLCLCQYDFTNELIKLNYYDIQKNRNFINKIWQSFRLFCIFKDNLDNINIKPKIKNLNQFELEICDKWILSCFSSFLISSKQNYENYKINYVCNNFLDFYTHDFCDTYLELIKPSIYENNVSIETKLMRFNILFKIFNNLFVVIHPIIPFLTEDLHQKLKYIFNKKLDPFQSILQVQYPDLDKFKFYLDENLENDMKIFQKCVSKIRFIKQLTLKHKKNFDCVEFFIKTNLYNPKFLKSTLNYINYLTKSTKIDFKENVNLVYNEETDLNNLSDFWYKDTFIMQLENNLHIYVCFDNKADFVNWAKNHLPVPKQKMEKK